MFMDASVKTSRVRGREWYSKWRDQAVIHPRKSKPLKSHHSGNAIPRGDSMLKKYSEPWA